MFGSAELLTGFGQHFLTIPETPPCGGWALLVKHFLTLLASFGYGEGRIMSKLAEEEDELQKTVVKNGSG